MSGMLPVSNPGLERARDRFVGDFLARADKAGLRIDPQGSERDLNLTDRLYWERKDDREFIAVLRPDYRFGVDGFIKQTGLHNEIDLLYVGVKQAVTYADAHWELYAAWMHDRRDVAATMALLEAIEAKIRSV